MKPLKISFLFSVLLTALLTTSCNIEPFEGDIANQENPSTETDGENEPNASAGTFQVDFDSKTYVADNSVATVLESVINISGLKTSTNEIITLTIHGNSVGTYQLGVTQNQVEVNGAAYNTNIDGTGDTWIAITDFMTSQGEITITEIDQENKTISGTFFFTGHNVDMPSKNFENGTFSKIPYEASLENNNSDNTFFAKVDGEEFVEDSIGGALLLLPGAPSTIMFTATKNSIETIGITVPADIVPGDYTFSTFDPPMGQYNLSFSEGTVSEEGGKLTITEHDVANKKLVGTFNFTASPLFGGGTQSYEITEGSFSVTYL